VRRLRPADWICGLGGLGFAGLLFAPWLGSATGWSALGWAGDVVAVLAIAGGAGIWLTIVADRAPSVQVITATGATVAAALVTIVAAIEVIGATDVRGAAYGGVAVAAVLAVACWRSMADERTDPGLSAYAPPPARPAPPA
jgi:hypothetical protein